MPDDLLRAPCVKRLTQAPNISIASRWAGQLNHAGHTANVQRFFARSSAGGIPPEQAMPEVWILGSSNYGAQLAAHFGLPYAYAYFFSEGRGVEEALRLYRDTFRPSVRHAKPMATVCIWALAAETESEARRLLMTREYWRVGFEKGHREPLVAPEEAAGHPYTPAELGRIEALRRKAFVGTGAQVAARLREEASRLQLDELVIVTWTFDPQARQRSYVLLAQAFALNENPR